MITIQPAIQTETSDADLVAQCLAGDRHAFGRIVARHQTLLCSVAYCATGSLSQSEDLAQDTFIEAWKRLSGLREPDKLRSWLCGILHNLTSDTLRKQNREPSHRAASLDEVSAAPSPEPQPAELSIGREESRILWSSIEKIPEIYRVPLVLFYRENQSVKAVAQKLDLSEDAVKQRLSRGRKLLHEQVLSFVEGALARSNPGKVFTLAVLASLPGFAGSAKAATTGSAIAGAKAAGTSGLLALFSGVFTVALPNLIAWRLALARTESEAERSYLKGHFRKIGVIVLALFAPFVVAVLWMTRNLADRSFLPGLFAAGLAMIYLPVVFISARASSRRSREYFSELLEREYGGAFPKPGWEYRSKTVLFGLPLVHIRLCDRFSLLKKPAVAWIAVANNAIGGLFAFGGTAVAPVSVGGLSIGLLSFGGLSVGVLALGGIATGVWAIFGGLIVGWQALGGCIAVAWNSAAGAFAIAHDFAVGRFALAAHANDAIAWKTIHANPVLHLAGFIGDHWLWLNLIWIVPFAIQWRIIAARHRSRAA